MHIRLKTDFKILFDYIVVNVCLKMLNFFYCKVSNFWDVIDLSVFGQLLMLQNI